jgi:7-cyano-7-deazaguanine synthase in queuosine biosynthesis
MTKDEKQMRTNRLRVFSPKERISIRRGEVACVIGKHVEIDTEALENYCFQRVTRRECELALLAGIVAFADRTFRRKLSEGWARRIEIIIPVGEPDFWNRTKHHLHEALEYLTGDCWEINFESQRVQFDELKQDILSLGSGKFIVVPYSNGLDSYAQSQLLKLRHDIFPIRITAKNQNIAGSRDWITEVNGTKYRRISIPVKFQTDPHPEPTYRTRTFVFNVFAGLAAHLSKAEAIFIPENGQGALGPSLVPFGSESPQRGSHPGFTRRMSQFFNSIWEDPIKIEHPQIWQTKGEVLQKLKKENLLGNWQTTRSCPRDQRNVNLNHKAVQCGICSGCMLRRMSIFSAGLVESDDTYLWQDLSANSLQSSMHPSAGRETTNNDSDIARHAIIALAELAQMADAPVDDPIIAQNTFEICGDIGKNYQQVSAQLQRLLNTHKSEWMKFVDSCGKSSWVYADVQDL